MRKAAGKQRAQSHCADAFRSFLLCDPATLVVCKLPGFPLIRGTTVDGETVRRLLQCAGLEVLVAVPE